MSKCSQKCLCCVGYMEDLQLQLYGIPYLVVLLINQQILWPSCVAGYCMPCWDFFPSTSQNNKEWREWWLYDRGIKGTLGYQHTIQNFWCSRPWPRKDIVTCHPINENMPKKVLFSLTDYFIWLSFPNCTLPRIRCIDWK